MNRILLIEDDSGAQVLYKNRLNDLGYEVVVSATGAMGLMEARAGRFDLFLVDIGLGSGIDGYEVCRRLKTIPEIHGVPVVLISGHVKAQEDLHRGYEAGCQSFLVKGDLMLLEDVVRAMLRIRSLQNDLALQNRLLEERNRKLEAERARAADLEHSLTSGGRAGRDLAPCRPDGLLLVDGEGVVQLGDRGARDLLGQGIEGKHLATLAPDSRLEAVVRNARTEPHESIRFEVHERPARPARLLSGSVFPLVPLPDRSEPTPRVVLLYDSAHRRLADDRGEHRIAGHLLEAAREVYQPQALIGTSPAIRDLRARVARAARSDSPALVEGPSGAGKRLAACILHFAGSRSGSFVSIPCGAFGAQQLELELFGGRAGPEGAEYPGAFQQAHNGMLYLEDADRLPLVLQERVLEAIEHGRVRRQGGSAPERVDVRVVASTRGDLARAVEQGHFRRDLFQRLAGERLSVPALAARRSDIEILAQHFLTRFGRHEEARFAPEAAWVLSRYDWPGNVLELAHAIRGACESAKGNEIGVGGLPQPLVELHRSLALGSGPRAPLPAARARGAVLAHEPEGVDTGVSLLDAYEKRALLHALRETGGDKLAAAKLVGVGKSTFYRKLKLHGLS